MTVIVAEVGANHCGSLQRARSIVEIAAKVGADAVKLQHWTDGTMVLAPYQLQDGPWKGWDLRELYAVAHTPEDWLRELILLIKERGMKAIVSVFDQRAVKVARRDGADMLKIASCELIDLQLVKDASETGLPIILSTGMATGHEVREAYAAAYGAAERPPLLLHCVSGYPTPASEANLWRLGQLKRLYGRCGLSDHSKHPAVIAAAIGMGAEMIEAHLIDKADPASLDNDFSYTPEEFEQMVETVRGVEAAMDDVEAASEAPTRGLRRSLHLKEAVKAGQLVALSDVTTARPAFGAHPFKLMKIVNRRAKRDMAAGEPLTVDDVT